MIRKFGGSSGIDSQPAGIDIGVGGLEINGIIEEYIAQAGSTISVGDFVEFVTKDQAVGAATILQSYRAYFINVVALSETQAMLILPQDNAVSGYATALIITVDGTTISQGTKLTFVSASISEVKAIKLVGNNVLVAYKKAGTAGTAIILSASGTTVTAGVETVFSPVDLGSISLSKLSDSSALVTYKNNSTTYGTAQVLTISGTAITAGSATAFNSTNSYPVSSSALSSTTAIVAFGYYTGSVFIGKALVLSISGTTITFGTAITFNDVRLSSAEMIRISDSQALVVYSGGSATSPVYYWLRAVIVSAVDTTALVSSDVLFSNGEQYDSTALCKLSDTAFILTSRVSGSYFLSSRLLIIRGNGIGLEGVENIFETARNEARGIGSLSKTKSLFIYYDYTNTKIKARLISASNYIKKSGSKNAIDGIAKTKAAAGETAKIYTL